MSWQRGTGVLDFPIPGGLPASLNLQRIVGQLTETEDELVRKLQDHMADQIDLQEESPNDVRRFSIRTVCPANAGWSCPFWMRSTRP
jgi:hypothetical protein